MSIGCFDEKAVSSPGKMTNNSNGVSTETYQETDDTIFYQPAVVLKTWLASKVKAFRLMMTINPCQKFQIMVQFL